MALALSMLIVSCLSVVIMTSLNLKVRLKGKVYLHLYWIIPVICATVLLATKTVPIEQLLYEFDFSRTMNPIKILVLFISVSVISIFVDQTGVFKWLAAKTVGKEGLSQKKLFVLLYLIISACTIVTRNSTILLTFTPFICYFARRGGVNPAPYLLSELVAANTWSMFFNFGNVTNLYVAESLGVDFGEYVSVMAVPTVFAAIASFTMLFILFNKDLKAPIEPAAVEITIKNKPALIVGVTGLAVCTILIIVASYAPLEMWLASLICATVTLIAGTICYKAKKQNLHRIAKTLRRAPWHLVPFLPAMYVIVLSLRNCGITALLTDFFGNYTLLSVGAISAVGSSFMNNIPLSMFFTDILSNMSGKQLLIGAYATVIGSNLSALLTPAASMSAVMWRSTMRHKHVDLSLSYLLSRGIIVAIPTIAAALGGLAMMSLTF